MIQYKDNKSALMLALSISVGLGVGSGAGFCSPGPNPPSSNISKVQESQFQKLIQETKKNLKLLEQERQARKSGSGDATYSTCRKLLDKLQEMAINSTQKADVHMLQGEFLELNGNINPENFRKALTLRENAFGSNNPKVAESLNKLAFIILREGNTSEAADLLNRSIKIMEFNKGAGANDLAETLDKCMKRGMSRAIEAKRITHKAARAIAKYAGKNDTALATCLHAVSLCGGEPNYIFGQEKVPPSEEEKALAQAVKLQEKSGGKDTLKIAEFLETQAKNERARGKSVEAAKTYKRVVEIREKLSSGNVSLLSRTYDQYAEYLINANDYTQAESFRKKGLSFFEKNPGEKDHALRTALLNMSYFYQNNRKLKEAANCYERILKLQNRNDDPGVGTIDNLSKIYLQMKDYPDAERTLKASLAIRTKVANPNIADDYEARANVLNLGMVETKLGKLDEAGKLLQQVKDSYDRSFAKTKYSFFGDKYPKDFMSAYVEYLEKAGKTSEAQALKARLEASLKKELDACLGCGRG